MLRKSLPTDLAKLNQEQLKKWINSFEILLTDCDGEYYFTLSRFDINVCGNERCFVIDTGVLWLYNNVIKNSNTVINKFLEMGKKVYFVTNNSTKTREELAEKAKIMNFNVGIVSKIS